MRNPLGGSRERVCKTRHRVPYQGGSPWAPLVNTLTRRRRGAPFPPPSLPLFLFPTPMHAAVGPGGGGSSARCDSQWATAPRLPTPAVRRGGEAAVAPAPPPTGTLPRRSRQLHRCGGGVQRVGPVCPGGPPSNGWQRASTIIAAFASTAAITAAPSPPNACLNLRLALDRVNACVADSPHAAAYVMAPPHSADMTCEVTRVPDSMDRTPSVTSLDVASDVSSLLSKAGPPLPKEPWATEEDAANGQRMTVLYEEDASTGLDRLEDATLAGLSLPVKGLSSMYFYDDKGSRTLDEWGGAGGLPRGTGILAWRAAGFSLPL